ncbi:hypothetical protein V6N11_000791 [Hibiscus sabdariffa]|uniref:Uncharacterized protein n=1 Tax=Hibiscus sabdariffa TaxID=183260 RepID=A0ABR2RXV6_9ROSI
MLSKITSLEVLALSNNSLLSLSTSGDDVNYSIPRLTTVLFSSCSIRQFPSLFQTSKLNVLDLSNNKISGGISKWEAQGSIAASNFSALRIIDLSRNEFSGTLPATFFRNLRAMTDVPKGRPSDSLVYCSDIYNTVCYQTSVNVTTKRLELELTKTVTILVSMDLSNNQFCGHIPEEVGRLVSLQMLNFSRNNFTGPIPASFENLVALESMDLSSNKLNGRIPSQLTKLTFLAVLNLSRNDLVGTIPHGNQFDTFDNDSYSGNLGLCGLPLSKQCNNHGEAEPPAPSVAEHEGSEMPFFSERCNEGVRKWNGARTEHWLHCFQNRKTTVVCSNGRERFTIQIHKLYPKKLALDATSCLGEFLTSF